MNRKSVLHSELLVAPISLSALHPLRSAVFVSEEGAGKINLEQDLEASTIHLGVQYRKNWIAGGSLVHQELDGCKALRIRAVAVNPSWQQNGIGTMLLNALIAQAQKQEGGECIWLSSFVSQVKFYERLGFKAKGAPYDRGVDGMCQLMIRKNEPFDREVIN